MRTTFRALVASPRAAQDPTHPLEGMTSAELLCFGRDETRPSMVETQGRNLGPVAFFDRNPAIDLPR